MTRSFSPRLFFTDLLDRDFRSRPANMPANLYVVILSRRGDTDWVFTSPSLARALKVIGRSYTPEMGLYCQQDVVVSCAVAKMFEPKLDVYQDCIATEHRIAELMAWQEREGFPFDVAKAHELESTLRTELDALSDKMRSTFLFVDGGTFTPKRNNGPQGYSLMRLSANSRSSANQSTPYRLGLRDPSGGWTAKEYRHPVRLRSMTRYSARSVQMRPLASPAFWNSETPWAN